MILLPAIDIRGGRCVRLEQGRLDRETVYADDPVATAEAFAAAGAEWLHVVDLDGAFSGSPRNLEVVRRIAAAVQVPFQLGGGLRRVDDVAEALHAGAHRVIVGTSALVEEDFIPALLERFGPERVVAGIDARDGMVAVRGWVEVSDVAATVLAARMRAMGVVRAVYTDVAQDGLLAGPNFGAIEEIARVSGLKIIASGGVSSLEDIRRLRALGPAGVEGAIVGKALYDGKLDLVSALAAARGE